jgi:hypothetical protein
MNKLLKRGLLGVAALSAPVTAAVVLPLAASASPSNVVTATTHLANRADTCACVTNVTSDNGDVWAYDNISRQFTVTDNGPTGNGSHTYTVAIADTGSFSAFADPNTGSALKVNGSLTGTNQYTVTATQAPDPSGLPSQIPNSTGTGDMITNDLFHTGTATITAEGNYTYSYHAGNNTYTQTTTGTTGDITGK